MNTLVGNYITVIIKTQIKLANQNGPIVAEKAQFFKPKWSAASYNAIVISGLSPSALYTYI